MGASTGADPDLGARVEEGGTGSHAPRWEKELYAALVQAPDVAKLVRVGLEFTQARPLAVLFEVLWEMIPSQDLDGAISALSWLNRGAYDPGEDSFVKKYLQEARCTTAIARGVEARLRLDRDYIVLLLARLHEANGNVKEAGQILQQLSPTTISAIALADYLLSRKQWPAVAEMTEELPIEDDASLYLLIQRGIALREQGFLAESRSAFNKALEFLDPSTELGRRAILERSWTYAKGGSPIAGEGGTEKRSKP